MYFINGCISDDGNQEPCLKWDFRKWIESLPGSNLILKNNFYQVVDKYLPIDIDLQHLKNRLLEDFAEQIEIEILLVEKIDSKDMKI